MCNIDHPIERWSLLSSTRQLKFVIAFRTTSLIAIIIPMVTISTSFSVTFIIDALIFVARLLLISSLSSSSFSVFFSHSFLLSVPSTFLFSLFPSSSLLVYTSPFFSAPFLYLLLSLAHYFVITSCSSVNRCHPRC